MYSLLIVELKIHSLVLFLHDLQHVALIFGELKFNLMLNDILVISFSSNFDVIKIL